MEQLVDNRYRIIKPLGSGGMAKVYLARDGVLERDVALKVMSGHYGADDEFVERFKREAQSAAALSHPNIVSIYDRGESEDGTYYIAMEYLPGGTLKEHIKRRGALPSRTAAGVALQIAEALRAAHQTGVIHRDIKPHNVLVTADGDVKVGDFGIARAASSSTMTSTGLILGTAHYISPEQAMGEHVGPRSDLYSLGIVLYEMLIGSPPYDADTPIGIVMKHVNGYLPPPKEINPEVPESLNAITMRLVEKHPQDRYASAGDLIEDLERVTNGLEPVNATTYHASGPTNRLVPAGATQQRSRTTEPIAPPPTPSRGDGRKGRRRRRWVSVLLLLLLALLGGAAYLLTLGGLLTPGGLGAQEIPVPNLVGYASLDEAQQAVGNSFQVAEGNREDSREATGTILSQSPGPGGTAERGSKISVDVSGTQIADLPDVTGQTRDGAGQTLANAGFQVSVQTATSSRREEGYVVDQDPKGGGGNTAEYGSTVAIKVGAGPEMVSVPELYNLSTSQSKQLLEGVGLSLGKQTEAPSSQVPKGQIIQQNPAAGKEAEPGSSVDVVVSSGPNQVSIPNVVGSSLGGAESTLWNAGFAYTVEQVQSNQPAGTVVSTDPAAGTLLDPYAKKVTIRQSSGPPQPTSQQKQQQQQQDDTKSNGDSNKGKSKAQ